MASVIILGDGVLRLQTTNRSHPMLVPPIQSSTASMATGMFEVVFLPLINENGRCAALNINASGAKNRWTVAALSEQLIQEIV